MRRYFMIETVDGEESGLLDGDFDQVVERAKVFPAAHKIHLVWSDCTSVEVARSPDFEWVQPEEE